MCVAVNQTPKHHAADFDDEFVRLLTTHKRQLFGFVYGMVHTIVDAEDVFQQVSLVLWEKFDQFQPDTDFVAWATSIARFKAIDFLRAKQRERSHFSEGIIDQLADREIERSRQVEPRAQALELCREKLSEGDQQTLRACYEQGISIKQAAADLDRPVGSVYGSLTRIRRILWKCIERTVAREDNS